MKMNSLILSVLCIVFFSSPAFSAEAVSAGTQPVAQNYDDWKYPLEPNEMDFGVLSGMGVLDSSAGFAVLGTISKKIVHDGFIPDISNSVSIEFQGGPLFVEGSRAFAYSTHLRWDFRRDAEWTLYALGGVSGHVTSDALGGRFLLFPRLGIGAIMETSLGFALRGELSHEFVTVGLLWRI